MKKDGVSEYTCSPGLIHKMGPSLLFVGCMSFNLELRPQGIVWKGNEEWKQLLFKILDVTTLRVKILP